MFLEVLGIVLGIVLVILVILQIEHQKNLKLFKQKVSNTLSKYGTISHENHMTVFNHHNISYQIIFFYLPMNHELTINSKIMWEIKDQFKSKLINQEKLLSSKLPKIVICYPSEVRVKRYINENELEFVKYNQSFYNMNVVRLSELETLLKGE
jgi:hypothetical protein